MSTNSSKKSQMEDSLSKRFQQLAAKENSESSVILQESEALINEIKEAKPSSVDKAQIERPVNETPVSPGNENEPKADSKPEQNPDSKSSTSNEDSSIKSNQMEEDPGIAIYSDIIHKKAKIITRSLSLEETLFDKLDEIAKKTGSNNRSYVARVLLKKAIDDLERGL